MTVLSTAALVLEEVRRVKRSVEDAQRWTPHFPVLDYIDEYSVLFGSERRQREFLHQAPSCNFELFNQTDDYMSRMDDALDVGFDVHFDFLRELPIDDGWPTSIWRVESMVVKDGGSAPLHSQATGGNPDYAGVFHASYKLTDTDAYNQELQRLKDHGLEMAAEYQNTYGRFSYWMVHPSLPWFKPRVNTRD